MFALYNAPILHSLCGNYSIASAHAEELLALAGEKGSLLWKSVEALAHMRSNQHFGKIVISIG
jgi:hypothetical protein